MVECSLAPTSRVFSFAFSAKNRAMWLRNGRRGAIKELDDNGSGKNSGRLLSESKRFPGI